MLAVAAMLTIAVLTGCTVQQSAQETRDTAAAGPIVETVESRDITDALALGAAVTAGMTYSISAPAIGALTKKGAHYIFRAADGVETVLAVPATAIAVEEIVPLSVRVAKNTPILSVRDTALTVVAQLKSSEVLRIGDRVPTSVRAQLDGSSAPFDCPLLDVRATATEDTYRLGCHVPDDVPVVAGATGLMVLVLDQRQQVATLPIEAVAGTISHGQVYLEDAPATATDVILGITDGVYVEITEGLALGARVLVPSPSILHD